MFECMSFASYLHGPPKQWASHSGGIHPAMPQALEIPGTHGTALESDQTQKLAFAVPSCLLQHAAPSARTPTVVRASRERATRARGRPLAVAVTRPRAPCLLSLHG
jgi:hypothetical protein